MKSFDIKNKNNSINTYISINCGTYLYNITNSNEINSNSDQMSSHKKSNSGHSGLVHFVLVLVLVVVSKEKIKKKKRTI